MLSSVANRVYWLARYIERSEDTARLLLVRHNAVLDMPREVQPGWGLILDVLGAQEGFASLPGASTETNIVNYVFSERANPSSILSSLQGARENMRTTREVLPAEAFELVNSLYLRVARRASKGLPRGSRHQVLNGIVESSQQISGMLSGAMNHDSAYQFVRMGRFLERADMTTRIVDVATTTLMDEVGEEALPYQNVLWISLLQSFSAYQMYRRSVQTNVKPAEVRHFLLRSGEFPRALAFCLTEVENSMRLLPGNAPALKVVQSVSRRLKRTNCRKLRGEPLHEFLDDMQLRLQAIDRAVAETWFGLS